MYIRYLHFHRFFFSYIKSLTKLLNRHQTAAQFVFYLRNLSYFFYGQTFFSLRCQAPFKILLFVIGHSTKVFSSQTGCKAIPIARKSTQPNPSSKHLCSPFFFLYYNCKPRVICDLQSHLPNTACSSFFFLFFNAMCVDSNYFSNFK